MAWSGISGAASRARTCLTTGWDSNCGARRFTGCASSGGFTQLRYQFNTRLFVHRTLRRDERFDRTASPATGSRCFGWAPSERSRITIEDVIAHSPQTTQHDEHAIHDRLLMRPPTLLLTVALLLAPLAAVTGVRAPSAGASRDRSAEVERAVLDRSTSSSST